MYKPNPGSAFRVKFDFRVDFTSGGYVEVAISCLTWKVTRSLMGD